MNDKLIERIVGHATIREVRAKYPVASNGVLAEAEKALGLEIPPFLRLIYAKVANGGFGPGYGIIGVKGGYASDLGTLVESYREVIKGAEYLGLGWRAGVLPFCGWGCNIFSCVDCNDPRYPIVRSEECKTHDEAYTLEDFFEMWLEGVDILVIGRSPGKVVEMINPFTRKKIQVRGRGRAS